MWQVAPVDRSRAPMIVLYQSEPITVQLRVPHVRGAKPLPHMHTPAVTETRTGLRRGRFILLYLWQIQPVTANAFGPATCNSYAEAQVRVRSAGSAVSAALPAFARLTFLLAESSADSAALDTIASIFAKH